MSDSLVGKVDSTQPMLLEATDLRYDFDKDIISASGSVEIYFDDYTLRADRVEYDRKDGRLFAYGHIRMTEPDGNLIQAESLELSDDFANGFIKALEIDTPQFTRLTAESGTRENNNLTTLENGAYSVYTQKPALWRIKAAKIVHNEQEQTIYFRRPSLEFFGSSIATVPSFTIADPSVKRKSGFLTPSFIYRSRIGYGLSIPYYWDLNPHYGLTTTLTPVSEQGALLSANWRQNLEGGNYTLSMGGIRQAQQEKFSGSSGEELGRFIVNTTGSFDLTDRWQAGWNLTLATDRAFREDYSFADFGSAQETSEIYLSGQSERNRFQGNIYAFQISQEDNENSTEPTNPTAPFSPVDDDLQKKQPVVHPVIDHTYFFAPPIWGGELAYTGNFTSLTRSETDAFSYNDVNRFRGVEGTFTRLSTDLSWRRTFIDPIGQVFTPFAYANSSLYFLGSADDDVEALTDDAVVFRGMPAIGLEYKYPILAGFDGGHQIIEPIAQIIARPNEAHIGELPNEDAQSMVYDASTLFEWDKFSGFDRDEGGVRANFGIQYRLQFDQGAFASATFGSSYQIAGRNSYATPDILDATGDSGLETDLSDYVASFYFDTNAGARIGTTARFDESDFSVQRAEVNASARYGPLSGVLSYAYLAARPDAGIDEDRQEVVGSANLNIVDDWRLFGSLRYDIENEDVVQNLLGLGYDDEGLSLAVSYAEDRSRDDGEPVEQIFYLRVGLRTIGDTDISTSD
ncbi:LPS-assembly protein LptD [Flexibacterium corallicola]|uniref:LPS-assembly protein LptD n=1 Tax=Flexibacterium corallicola TaxID=3037259 RepID=UPI00286FA38F|nr:LPS assembly protein LptD [Pseudovibrio sp. M1P-2-3]